MISTENSLSVGGGKDWLILELPNYWCLLFLLCQNKFLEHFLEPAPPLKVTQVAISTECTRRSSFAELCACIVCPADVVGHHSVCQCVCWSPVFAVIGPKEGDHKKFDLSPLLKEVQVPIQIIPFSNQNKMFQDAQKELVLRKGRAVYGQWETFQFRNLSLCQPWHPLPIFLHPPTSSFPCHPTQLSTHPHSEAWTPVTDLWLLSSCHTRILYDLPISIWFTDTEHCIFFPK